MYKIKKIVFLRQFTNHKTSESNENIIAFFNTSKDIDKIDNG